MAFESYGALRQEVPTRWRRDMKLFKAWREGRTSYPLIDAFMRELMATGRGLAKWVFASGYVCHMGRETAGWFLARDLGVDWRLGAEWFESQLLDYEPAANWFNWAYRHSGVKGFGDESKAVWLFDGAFSTPVGVAS